VSDRVNGTLQDLIKVGWTMQARLHEIVKHTGNGGGEIAAQLKTRSAFTPPAREPLRWSMHV
jgi:hypothetical protein